MDWQFSRSNVKCSFTFNYGINLLNIGLRLSQFTILYQVQFDGLIIVDKWLLVGQEQIYLVPEFLKATNDFCDTTYGLFQ